MAAAEVASMEEIPMFRSIRVQDYRGLRDLEVSPLRRINLIAGENNTGKTSLLEAIFLLTCAGNPQIAVNPNVIRGLDPDAQVPLAGMLPAGERVPWKEIFSDLDMSRSIEVAGHYFPLGQLEVKITSERPTTTEIPLGSTGDLPITNLQDKRALIFRYNGPDGTRVEGHIRMKGQGIEISQTGTDVPFNATLLLSGIVSFQEDAVRLGMLRRQKRGDLLLEALRVVEPKLQSIEESSASGTPMIWGDVGLSELIPLPVMGEGMTRIARLVLAISSSQSGVVLVDEVENGLHHKVLPKVWGVINTAAAQFNTQIFATTHSFECIRAAHESLNRDDFRLHRLEVVDSVLSSVTYEPEAIGAAIYHGFEVR